MSLAESTREGVRRVAKERDPPRLRDDGLEPGGTEVGEFLPSFFGRGFDQRLDFWVVVLKANIGISE